MSGRGKGGKVRSRVLRKMASFGLTMRRGLRALERVVLSVTAGSAVTASKVRWLVICGRKGIIDRRHALSFTVTKKPAIRRLARRGGVKRISGLIYEDSRGALKYFLDDLVQGSIIHTQHANR